MEIVNAIVSSDASVIASISWDQTVRIWDLLSGLQVHCLGGDEFDVAHQYARSHEFGGVVSMGPDSITPDAMAFAPDCRSLVCGIPLGTVTLWDLKTGLERHRFCQRDKLSSVDFSPSGTFLVAGFMDGAVLIWNCRTAELLHHLELDSGVTCVKFSGSGHLLAASSTTGSVKVWDYYSINELAHVPPKTELSNSSYLSHTHTLQFSPDNRLVLIEDDLGYLQAVELPSASKFAASTEISNITDERWNPIFKESHRLTMRSTGEALVMIDAQGLESAWYPVAEWAALKLAVCPADKREWAIYSGGGFALIHAEGVLSSCPPVESSETPVDLASKQNPTGLPDNHLPLVTCTRFYDRNEKKWEDHWSAACPWCLDLFEPDHRIIEILAENIRLQNDQLCSNWPETLSEDTRLISSCPKCSSPLRFTPFGVDHQREYTATYFNDLQQQERTRQADQEILQLSVQAEVNKKHGRYRETLQQLAIVVQYCESHNRHGLLWECLILQAQTLELVGDIPSALKIYEQLLAQSRTPSERVHILDTQANLLYNCGEFDFALDRSQESERLYRYLDDQLGLATSLGNQAVCLRELQDMGSALKKHREEEAICRNLMEAESYGVDKHPCKEILIRCLGNQVTVLISLKRYQEAIRISDEEAGLLRQNNKYNKLPGCLVNRALAVLNLSGPEAAIPVVQEAREIASANNLPEEIRRAEEVLMWLVDMVRPESPRNVLTQSTDSEQTARIAHVLSSQRENSRQVRGFELIREGQAEKAVDLLIGAVYRPGKITMLESATEKDILLLGAALIESGQYTRALSLANAYSPELHQAGKLIREIIT
ncbi:MAG: hypothetical protein KDA78_17595, partial [Planctomycetaceae bacterium]|nr:hypothetical protein [Planctomycetaceae bacterium]